METNANTFTRSSGDASSPKSNAGSAGTDSSARPFDVVMGWFKKSGIQVRAYRSPRPCLLCGKQRRLFVEHDGAEICYLEFEAARFDFMKALRA